MFIYHIGQHTSRGLTCSYFIGPWRLISCGCVLNWGTTEPYGLSFFPIETHWTCHFIGIPVLNKKPMWCFFAPVHLEYVLEGQLKWGQHEGTKKTVGHVGNPMTWPIHKVSCLIRMHKSSGIMGLWVIMGLCVYSLFHAFHTTHDPNFLLTYLEIHRLLDHSRAFCRSLLSLLSGSSGSWYTRPAAKHSKTVCV